MKREFQYPSRDGVTQIHAIEWEPEGEIHAVMQLCHGNLSTDMMHLQNI